MDFEIEGVLKSDFEKYMYLYFNEFKRFNLEDFVDFSVTLLNHYVGNQAIAIDDKKEAAYYLCTLYNKGLGNKITEEHLQLIAQTIASDYSVKFDIIKRLFN